MELHITENQDKRTHCCIIIAGKQITTIPKMVIDNVGLDSLYGGYAERDYSGRMRLDHYPRQEYFKLGATVMPDKDILYTMQEVRDMKVNMMETTTEFLVEVALPGMEESEVDLTYENGKLTIVTNPGTTRDSSCFSMMEFNDVKETRTLNIPNVSGNRMSATLSRGVLTIRLPKDKCGKKITIHGDGK